jgi:dihydroorotate dehydrogenase electron transfer subunit
MTMMEFKQAEIISVVEETPTTNTLYMKGNLSLIPGEFIMLSDFNTGEKPYSISYAGADSFAVTVKKVGKFSSTIASLQAGDSLYYRGPYGKGFTFPAKDELIVIAGGGCGTAPLRYLLNYLLANKYENVIFINGAKTKNELLYHKELADVPVQYIAVTDDGSNGIKATALDALLKIADEKSIGMLYTAGPEMMMKNILAATQHLSCKKQFLLERYMKCGVGICGQCTLDPIGIRLCLEGPVIDSEILLKAAEFGQYTRNAAGKRVAFATCN